MHKDRDRSSKAGTSLCLPLLEENREPIWEIRVKQSTQTIWTVISAASNRPAADVFSPQTRAREAARRRKNRSLPNARSSADQYAAIFTARIALMVIWSFGNQS